MTEATLKHLGVFDGGYPLAAFSTLWRLADLAGAS
jgi:hypothetical protein